MTIVKRTSKGSPLTALEYDGNLDHFTDAVAGRAPLAHTHPISDVTGLATALAGKAEAAGTTAALAGKLGAAPAAIVGGITAAGADPAAAPALADSLVAIILDEGSHEDPAASVARANAILNKASADAPEVPNLAVFATDEDGEFVGLTSSGLFARLAPLIGSASSWKGSVRAATTANGTLASAYAAGQTVDGVVLAVDDDILIKNQTSGVERGIYRVNASGAPTRRPDADTGVALLGATVVAREGTVNADTIWACSTNGPITIGATSLDFIQFGAIAADAADVWAGSASNKWISPDVSRASQAPISVSDAATITLNLAAGINFEVGALTATRVLAFSNYTGKAGRSGHIVVLQNGTGGWGLTAGTDVLPSDATAGVIALNDGANERTVIPYLVTSGNKVLLG